MKIDKLAILSTWITQGPNPTFADSGTPCLTGRNINKGKVDYKDSDYVDNYEYQKLKRYQLRHGDTLITLKGKGSIGKIGFVLDNRPAIFSRDIGIIRPNKSINSGFLNIYILSKYGSKIIERGETGGTGQSTLTTSYLRHMQIPRFSFEDKIGDLLKRSEDLNQQAVYTYKRAEEVLRMNMSIQDFEYSAEKINIKNFTDSFLLGRLDAEYYQPKYEDYLSLIYNYRNGWAKLVVTCNVKDANFIPIYKNTYQYIELADIGKSGEIIDCTIAIGSELPTRARRKVCTGDVIISSIEGSLESCALVQEDYNGALCSTGFYIVNSQKINSETLLVLFKSELMQSILKQRCSGTILTAINKDEFLNIPIPLIEEDIQQEVQEKVSESFMLRRDSENILGIAKRAVEIAIEKGEEQSLEFIKINTD